MMGGRGRPHVSLVLPPSSTIPLVDRETERKALSQILLEAQQGKGSTWLIDGPGGIGKTRLAQWVRDEAERRGFLTRSGHCLKEVNNAFFPWLQIFRGSASLPANRLLSGTKFPPGVHIFEEERPERIWVRLLETSIVVPDAMVISREKAGAVRQRLPSLPSTVRMLCFSRVEGTDLISPVQLDVLGETLSSWLREHPGGMVGLVGLEYLVTQNTFLPVLRLVQFLREIADETGGRILLSFRPDTLEDRERSLLEAEGEVERVSRPNTAATTESSNSHPCMAPTSNNSRSSGLVMASRRRSARTTLSGNNTGRSCPAGATRWMASLSTFNSPSSASMRVVSKMRYGFPPAR